MEKFKGDIIMWGPHWGWIHYLPQQMAYEISKYVRVLYVNTPSIIIKSLLPKRWGRLMTPRKELIDWFHPLTKVNKNLFIYTPPPILLPYGHLKAGDNISQAVHLHIVKRTAQKLNFKNPILWNPPFFLGYVPIKDVFKGSFICYDLVCDIRNWTKFNWKRERLQIAERRFLESVDLVIISVPTLYDDKAKLHKNSHYLPPGADVDNYLRALSNETTVPEDISHIRHPVIGFMGAMNNMKIDWELIRFVALSHQEWSFVMMGTLSEEPEISLRDLKNINFLLGIKPVTELPGYLKAFDVSMIPYKVNAFGKYAFPAKAFEHLAGGKPVVSTDLPALRKYHPLIKAAHSKGDFLRFIEQSLDEKDESYLRARIDLAREHTLEARAQAALELIAITDRAENRKSNGKAVIR